MLACALTGRPGAWVGLMAGNSSLNGCSALNLNRVQELSFSCHLLIEAGMAVRYDGGTKTKDWCE